MPKDSPNAFNIYESNYYMFQKKDLDYDAVIEVEDESKEEKKPKDKSQGDKDKQNKEKKEEKGSTDDKGKKEKGEPGYEYYAHSFILKSRCPSLASEKKEEHGGIFRTKVKYVKKEHMHEMMRYMYVDECVLTLDNAFSILRLARNYEQRTMVDYCKKFITDNIKVKTVCKILQQALANREGQIRDSCLDFIALHTKEVLNDRSFLFSDEATIDAITSLDKLNMDELDLFKHILLWANFDPKTGREKPEEPRGEELKKQLGIVLTNRRIRFPLMSGPQFTKWVIPLKILEDGDMVEINKYIQSPDKGKPYTSFNSRKRRPVTVAQ